MCAPGREWTTTLEMMATGRLRTAEIVSLRESLDRLPDPNGRVTA